MDRFPIRAAAGELRVSPTIPHSATAQFPCTSDENSACSRALQSKDCKRSADYGHQPSLLISSASILMRQQFQFAVLTFSHLTFSSGTFTRAVKVEAELRRL